MNQFVKLRIVHKSRDGGGQTQDNYCYTVWKKTNKVPPLNKPFFEVWKRWEYLIDAEFYEKYDGEKNFGARCGKIFYQIEKSMSFQGLQRNGI